MKRLIFSGFLALVMCGTTFTAQGQTWDISATAVDHVTATLSGSSPNYTLTISGTGNMQDFTLVPWEDVKSEITSLVINYGITTIGAAAFYGCSGLTGTLTIPNSVQSTGYAAFAYCINLTSVSIPNSMILIGNNTFGSCSGLTSVTIPASVSSIGQYAFAYCSGLTSITCLNSNPDNITLNGEVFYEVDKNSCVLYVPVGSEALYQVADHWRDFYPNIVGIATGIQNVEISNLKLFPNPVKDFLCVTAESPISKVEIYNTDGKMLIQENNFAEKMNVSSLAKGLYVVRVYTAQGTETVKIIKN